MHSTRVLTASVLVMAIFGTTTAVADAPCAGGFRDSTPAERARMTAILETAKKSLPPAPAGWQIGGYEEISVQGSVCRDGELRPWSYGISRNFTRVDDAAAQERAMQETAAHLAAEQAKKQPRIDALMAQMQKLAERQAALVQKGDMAGAEKLNHEMVKLQAQFEKIANEGDSEARIAAAGKESNRDRFLSVSVRINETSKPLVAGAANFALPTGATAAQRWTLPGDAHKSEEGRALVLYGTWNRVAQTGQWKAARRANAVPTAAHVISVEIIGDPARIDPMLKAIDFKSLATALTK
jgi:hypothetical protein